MSEDRKYIRFSLSDRIEHWIQMAGFAILGLTGLIQKFAGVQISQTIIALLGGIEAVRIIHRAATIALMVGVIYHLGTAGYKIFVKRTRLSMLPALDDVKAAWDSFLFNLGMKDTRPQQGRYTFDEKFEYWAFVWGTVIMGFTGFMLWNPIATTRFLPGVFIPAAKAAHGGEAILAILAIIVWHFYNVHVKHLNKSMFTGYISEEDMLEEHPKELADIKAGITGVAQSPEEIKKRQKVYIPTFGVISSILVVGVYLFITMEKTAIETIVPPDDSVAVFVPLTPTPFPTPIPTPTMSADQEEMITTWEGGIGDLFLDRCGQCHGELNMGGLNVTTYESLHSGSDSGQLYLPGDAENSLILKIQAAGDHAGQYNGTELALIRDWINNSAPEN